ncbi:MAG: glycosyltransferase [Gemmatimonadaceae bacterium]
MHVLVLPSWYHTQDRPYAGTFFRDWALAMQTAGMRVGVAFPEMRSLRQFNVARMRESHFQTTVDHSDGFPCVRLRSWNPGAQYALGGLVWAQFAQGAIDSYIKRYGRPDLVAAYSAHWAGYAAFIAQRRLGLPYVITEVDTQFGLGAVRGLRARLARRAYASANAVIAISDNLHSQIRKIGELLASLVLPCTVDDRYWTPPPAKRTARPFTFYTQAHFAPRKGFDLLLRAFARAFAGDPDVRLWIGGDGAIGGELRRLASQLGLDTKVSFLGALPRDGVRRAMWEADCFVLPSLAENFGVVLIEALATGLPLISTRCGGPEDIITAEVGTLLTPGDEVGLESALIAMRQAQAQGKFRETALANFAREKYGYESIGRRLMILCEAVADRQVRSG